MPTIVRAQLESVSPYSQSSVLSSEKLPSESHDDYETRCWRDRIHTNRTTGEAYIPPMAFKKCLDAAAKYSSLKVAGKGQATYTKHVESGTMISDPLRLGVKATEVEGETLFLDANGKKGKGSSGRVRRIMPHFPEWKGEITILVMDEKVLNMHPGKKDRTVLEEFLRTSGALIGIGRFRPENGGYYGRFKVTKFTIGGDYDV